MRKRRRRESSHGNKCIELEHFVYSILFIVGTELKNIFEVNLCTLQCLSMPTPYLRYAIYHPSMYSKAYLGIA